MAAWGISTSGKMVFLGLEKDTPRNGPQPGDIVIRKDGRYRILSDGSECFEGKTCELVAEDIVPSGKSNNSHLKIAKSKYRIF